MKARAVVVRTADGASPGLQDLPLQTLAAICTYLSLRDRLRLLAASGTLWRLLGNGPELWGDLELASHSPDGSQCAAWLGARRRALARLRLCSTGGGSVQPILASLQGSSLQELDWGLATHPSGAPGSGVSLPIAPLAALRLRSLRLSVAGGEVALDAALQGCSTLQQLHLSAAAVSIPSQAALPASLLELHVCCTRWDGAALAGLLAGATQLQQLSLALHPLPTMPAAATPAAIAAVGALPALSHLSLALRRPPPTLDLSPLAALACPAVSLGIEYCRLQEGGAAALLAQLAGVAGLTRLRLHGCELRDVPHEAAQLTALRHLDLSYNWLGSPEAALSLGPALGPLRGLTHLDLSRCGLPHLPQQLSVLAALQRLELGHSAGSGGSSSGSGGLGASLDACLPGLMALTRLGLAACGLALAPRQLAAAPHLRELDLSGNLLLEEGEAAGPDGASEGGEGPLAPLAHCTALSRLDLSSCRLVALPTELAPLRQLAHLQLDYNATLAEAGQSGFAALGALGMLTHLGLACCQLPVAPRELGELSRLESLAVDFGTAVASFGALEPLTALTSLLLTKQRPYQGTNRTGKQALLEVLARLPRLQRLVAAKEFMDRLEAAGLTAEFEAMVQGRGWVRRRRGPSADPSFVECAATDCVEF